MRNPFLEHKLSAISVGAETKWQTRLLPTMAEFEKRFGKPPEKLTRCQSAWR
jgi:tagaturonate reductase